MADLAETASELESIARHLRRIGELELRQELQKSVTRAVRDVEPVIRRELGDFMPDRYAKDLNTDLQIRTSTRLARDDPQASLIGTPRGPRSRALRRLEGGTLGHPVFGRRSRFNPRLWESWVYQQDGVTAGFFAGPSEQSAPQVLDAINEALRTVSNRATRKGT